MPFETLETHRITSVKGDFFHGGAGSTLPLLVRASDRNLYVLKTRYNTNSVYKDCSIFNELLAYKIHKKLKYTIAPQRMVLLYVDTFVLELLEKSIDEGIIDSSESANFIENIKKSLGWNLGIEYFEDTDKFNFRDDISIKNSFKNEVIHLDNFLLNSDRTEKNPNILKRLEKDSLIAIDFDNAFNYHCGCEPIKSGDLLLQSNLKECNALDDDDEYLFHQDVCTITPKSCKISKKDIIQIIETFPEEWEPVKWKETIAEVLVERMKQKEIWKKGRKCVQNI